MKSLFRLLAASALLGALSTLPASTPAHASSAPGDVATGAGSWQNGPNTITYEFSVGTGIGLVKYSMSSGVSFTADVHCYNIQGNTVSIEALIPAPLPAGIANAGVYVYAVDNPGTTDDQVGYSFGSPYWWADCSAPHGSLWSVPGGQITVVQGVHGRVADMKVVIEADPSADHGTVNSLEVQLRNVERSYDAGKQRPACSQLSGFVESVKADYAAGNLTELTYTTLLADAAALGSVMHCAA